MISARFVLYIFLVSLDRNNLYLTFKYKMSIVVFFKYIYGYYKYTAKKIDHSIIYFC